MSSGLCTWSRLVGSVRFTTGWPVSSHDHIPTFSPTFQLNIYGVSTLATAAIQNKMHAISHCNTHIFSHNYDNYVLYTKLYPVKNSFLAYFLSRTILAVTEHMSEHISPDFSLTTLKFPDCTGLPGEWHPVTISFPVCILNVLRMFKISYKSFCGQLTHWCNLCSLLILCHFCITVQASFTFLYTLIAELLVVKVMWHNAKWWRLRCLYGD